MRVTFTKQKPFLTMTKAKALAIQAEQVAHYSKWCPTIDLAALVAAQTTADQLPDVGEIDVIEINRHIPRGGSIESIIAKATAVS